MVITITLVSSGVLILIGGLTFFFVRRRKLYKVKTEREAAPIPAPPKPKPLRPKSSEAQRPIEMKNILENRIKPEKSEYLELKDLDTRMHTLKFSNAIGKRNNEFLLEDGTKVKFNRYYRFIQSYMYPAT